MMTYTKQIEDLQNTFKNYFKNNFQDNFQGSIEKNSRAWQLCTEYQFELVQKQFKFCMDVFSPNVNKLNQANYTKENFDIVREKYMTALREFNEDNINSTEILFTKLNELHHESKNNNVKKDSN
jgi:hypothetical protein